MNRIENIMTREVVTDWPVASHGPFVVALDPALSPALVQEGLAREIVNRVQRLRKDAGFEVTTRIVLALEGDEPLREAARAHAEYIAGETLAVEFAIGEPLAAPDRIEPVEIDGHAAALGVRRHPDGRDETGPTEAERA